MFVGSHPSMEHTVGCLTLALIMATAVTGLTAGVTTCTGFREGWIGVCVPQADCGGTMVLSRDCLGGDACCVGTPCDVPAIGWKSKEIFDIKRERERERERERKGQGEREGETVCV